MRTVEQNGYKLELDQSNQALSLEIPERQVGQSRLLPTLASGSLNKQSFVSASALAAKAKLFDDGLLAAVEILSQRSSEDFGGKAYMLSTLASLLGESALPSGRDPVSLILAANRLGGSKATVPDWIADDVEQGITAFLSDERASKPVGFYTWTKELESIFQQDRLLQCELEGQEGIAAIVTAINSDEKLKTTYKRHINLISKLTNPLRKKDLQGLLDQKEPLIPPRGLHFFPPSRSHETDLVQRLFGNSPIPEGFDLLSTMIARIRSGELTLTPSPDSGWYDLQTWALEPLVTPESTPESSHLKLHESYRSYLLDLFRSLMSLTREGQIKQLDIPCCGSAAMLPPTDITICPELSAEPTLEFYLRRSLSYRFVRRILSETFGSRALERVPRLTADGATRSSLDAELSQMEGLFYGAYLTVAQQLGVPIQNPSGLGSGRGSQSDAELFLSWLNHLGQDLDLSRDTRMMVPVFYDVQRRKTKAWVFLGWTSAQLLVSFAREPQVISLEKTGPQPATALMHPSQSLLSEGEKPRVRFTQSLYNLDYPVMAEIYVERILNREEFQSHCTRYETAESILSHL